VLARLDELLAATPSPAKEELNAAFWQACHGGQRRAAERLLAAGADIEARPDYAGHQTALDVATAPDTSRDLLASWLQEHDAARSEQ
jgi:hypothetical protein